ncbi:hypothetical protein CONPUDRAFT_68853 [Coniophora puteana RWD-64-598 SS2]|uniref:Uncharacterized protein n=1 Tax=Coniophora puteana (strain RWD-64-598) TaxID=741705 RepID=A0A5M3N5G4_CONPW|nr:uncharacterized protein CONPUDRAFT_68853 [Coniophora puteana RWD-64-598 SS2]EIW86304.1 hypothetical protein CONPUDRAFT_68853 [Coniophora puteana RWD-64-598 SS2]
MSACAVGVDNPRVTIVIQWGVCCNIPDWNQRGGRVARTLHTEEKVPPDKIDDNPDTALRTPLPEQSSKQHRLGAVMIHLINSKTLCVHDFLATYFDNNTPERDILRTSHLHTWKPVPDADTEAKQPRNSRVQVKQALQLWQDKTWRAHPLCTIVAPDKIIDNEGIEDIASIFPLLWGQEVAEVVYACDLAADIAALTDSYTPAPNGQFICFWPTQ